MKKELIETAHVVLFLTGCIIIAPVVYFGGIPLLCVGIVVGLPLAYLYDQIFPNKSKFVSKPESEMEPLIKKLN
jgi:hypothetical protein